MGILFDSISVEHGNVELQCSKEHLLEYKEWKPENIKFLESCPELLPIKEYVQKMNLLLVNIYNGFVKYFVEELQDMHNNIMKLMKEYNLQNPMFI